MKKQHDIIRNAGARLAAAWMAASVSIFSATALADTGGGLVFYRSPTKAREAALDEGKALFVLSGADWCGYCDVVKDYLQGLGSTFSSRYVLYYCDIDTDTAGMAACSPQYGVFDPAPFKASLGWSEDNGMLAYDIGDREEWVKGVLDAGWAAWTKRCTASFKVKFNANGGNGKMAAQTMTCGKAAKLRKNAFTRKGYVFLGWATTKANAKKGLVAYGNAQSVKNLCADCHTTTLYAVWAKKTYKVKFYANGGTKKMAEQSFTYGKAKKLAANKFKAPKGKKFVGWAKSKAAAKKGKVAYKNKAKVKNLVITGKTVKLYAVWGKK